MEGYLKLSRIDLEIKLSTQHVRVSQIINLAMLAGPFIFIILTFIIFLKNKSLYIENTHNQDTIYLLIYVLIFLAVVIYSIFILYPRFFFKPDNLKKRLSRPFYDQTRKKIEDPITKLFILERILMISRLAMLEGVSLFGIVILFLAVSEGYMSTQSHLWFLLTPWFIQTAFVFINFPSKSRILDKIENCFLSSLRGY